MGISLTLPFRAALSDLPFTGRLHLSLRNAPGVCGGGDKPMATVDGETDRLARYQTLTRTWCGLAGRGAMRRGAGRDMNRLIMNYLVVEGYKDAAELFSAEAGIAPPNDLGAIQDRMEIRRAVQSGQITRAIELVNELNPEVGVHAAHARQEDSP